MLLSLLQTTLITFFSLSPNSQAAALSCKDVFPGVKLSKAYSERLSELEGRTKEEIIQHTLQYLEQEQLRNTIQSIDLEVAGYNQSIRPRDLPRRFGKSTRHGRLNRRSNEIAETKIRNIQKLGYSNEQILNEIFQGKYSSRTNRAVLRVISAKKMSEQEAQQLIQILLKKYNFISDNFERSGPRIMRRRDNIEYVVADLVSNLMQNIKYDGLSSRLADVREQTKKLGSIAGKATANNVRSYLVEQIIDAAENKDGVLSQDQKFIIKKFLEENPDLEIRGSYRFNE